MPKFDYNVIVIGGGSAGLVSAYIAAAVKAKCALIEGHKMGGDCLNTGCVPSKALIQSAKVLAQARRGNEFGLQSTEMSFDFKDVMERVQDVITRIEPHDSHERYTKLGVECITGYAKITGPHEVEVEGRTLTAKAIIVATGARPMVPKIAGLQEAGYLTSDTLWSLRELPREMVILGGGPIGCEMAQAFARYGSQVTIVEMAPHLLGREDEEVSRAVEKRFEEEGIKLLLAHRAEAVQEGHVHCAGRDGEVRVAFDQLFVALGRQANVTGFGLEELGVTLRPSGTIDANPFLQTNVPSIYVCGDVTGPYQFTHTAAHQAWYAAINALFSPLRKFKVDYRVIPAATFTDPEVARVGLNEKEARDQNIAYDTTTYGIDDLDRAIMDQEAHGFVKVLTAPRKDKILGVTIVGSHASEVITEYILAMKQGIGLNKILGTTHIYPTLSEANKYAAGAWKRQNAPQFALRLLEKFHRWRL